MSAFCWGRVSIGQTRLCLQWGKGELEVAEWRVTCEGTCTVTCTVVHTGTGGGGISHYSAKGPKQGPRIRFEGPKGAEVSGSAQWATTSGFQGTLPLFPAGTLKSAASPVHTHRLPALSPPPLDRHLTPASVPHLARLSSLSALHLQETGLTLGPKELAVLGSGCSKLHTLEAAFDLRGAMSQPLMSQLTPMPQAFHLLAPLGPTDGVEFEAELLSRATLQDPHGKRRGCRAVRVDGKKWERRLCCRHSSTLMALNL